MKTRTMAEEVRLEFRRNNDYNAAMTNARESCEFECPDIELSYFEINVYMFVFVFSDNSMAIFTESNHENDEENVTKDVTLQLPYHVSEIMYEVESNFSMRKGDKILQYSEEKHGFEVLEIVST